MFCKNDIMYLTQSRGLVTICLLPILGKKKAKWNTRRQKDNAELPCLPRPESKKGQGKGHRLYPEVRRETAPHTVSSSGPRAFVSVFLSTKDGAPATTSIYVASILVHVT